MKAIDALSKLCDRLGMRPGKKPHLEGKHHHKKKAALKKVSVSNKEHLEDAEASHVDAERNEKDALKAVQNLIRLSTKMTKTGESFGKEHMKEIREMYNFLKGAHERKAEADARKFNALGEIVNNLDQIHELHHAADEDEEDKEDKEGEENEEGGEGEEIVSKKDSTKVSS